MKIGILALQGAVDPHAKKIQSLGATPVPVIQPDHLVDLSGIILPGGESTTMLHLLKLNQLWEPLRGFLLNAPSWGVCAGAILLAREVKSPSQDSLGILDITVERNAFGRQIHSFIGTVQPTEDAPTSERIDGVFIRAPRILRVGPQVKTLYLWKDEPVMVSSGLTFASTFHPELSQTSRLHESFLAICKARG